jgi:voltage-gated potassium channel Kch
LILGLVAILLTVKFTLLFTLGRVFGMGLDQNLAFAFALAQGGEFAFVLFSFATQNDVLEQETVGPLVAVVALSMALTPLVMLINERFFRPRFGTRAAEEREADIIDEESQVIIAGFGRFGSVVGRLLTANGVRTTVLDIDSDQVDMLRRIGLKVFYGDASRHDLLQSAGAASARLLVLALDSPKKTAKLVRTAKKHFPHLTILARASGRADAYDLVELGVEHVYRETLDTSLRMGVDALHLVGLRTYHAHRAARKFRMHDEKSVRDLAAMRHDQKSYINLARERIRDLEKLLLSDLRDRDADTDAGWDAESLRQEFGQPTDH